MPQQVWPPSTEAAPVLLKSRPECLEWRFDLRVKWTQRIVLESDLFVVRHIMILLAAPRKAYDMRFHSLLVG